MAVPTIHLNGTTADELLAGYSEAKYQLSLARDAIAKTAPNGRDYYPQGPNAIVRAEIAHRGRVLTVENLMDELDAIMEAIASQRDERESTDLNDPRR